MNFAIVKSVLIHGLILLLVLFSSLFDNNKTTKPQQSIKVTSVAASSLIKKPEIKQRNQAELSKRIQSEIHKNSTGNDNPKPKKPRSSKLSKEPLKKPKPAPQKPIVDKTKQQRLVKVARDAKAKQDKIRQQKIEKLAQQKAEKERKRQKWLKKVKKRLQALEREKKLAHKTQKQKDDVAREHKRQEWLKKLARTKEEKDKARRQRERKLIQQAILNNANPPRKANREVSKVRENKNSEQDELNTIISQYSELIRKKMATNWTRPINTRTLSLKTTVGIKLRDNGSIDRVRVIRSSGYLDFDASVLNALWRANILPVPKKPKYLKLFTDGELEMEFKNF